MNVWRKIKCYIAAATAVIDVVTWTLEERRKFKSRMPWYVYDMR